jgi:hypothetical protein
MFLIKINPRQLWETLTVPDKAVLSSVKIAQLIAKKEKAHDIGKKIILPACKEIVEVILGSEAAEEISKVPLSNDTVHRRVAEMSTDTENNVLGKLQTNTNFCFQLDEITNVSGKAQLISFVRFVEGPEIIEQLLFCRQKHEEMVLIFSLQ